VITLLKYLWVSPASTVGVIAALLALLLGGRAQIHTGVLEVSLQKLSAHSKSRRRRLPFAAITLGHVVIAVHQEDQARYRAHERIHVAQYTRWGALFFIAYPMESLWQLLQGRRPYLDNRFEVQARLADSTHQRTHKII
jgi:hypothetical protein